jgi:hypothetical protein
MYTYYINGINFAKDYQNDSNNKRIFIEKNIDDKTYYPCSKKIHIFFNVEFQNFKNSEMFQNCFKIASKFQSFKSLLPHINGL